ncbi:hypothetical protein AQI88_41200 [Streptomyces cellostaticus]|uniref:Uncharacterized protein n=2 Tax=Streptomyces cellostaticus TaxID=67285 RepID=A0A101N502_9ACTN|nr:hypothetical protein AQI88_41200 [Streptomyces cellostaticus]
MSAATGKRLDLSEQAGDLSGVRHTFRVEFVGNLGSTPAESCKRVLPEVASLGCDTEHFIGLWRQPDPDRHRIH